MKRGTLASSLLVVALLATPALAYALGDGSLAGADAQFLGDAGQPGIYYSLGVSVAPAGDVNGDGYDDLLIGALYGPELTTSGAVHLVLGGPGGWGLGTGPANPSIITYVGETDADQAGWSVAGAGDVNGDGYDDLLVGARFNDAGGGDSGAAYLVLGSATPTDVTLSAATATKYTGEAAGDYAGWSVAGAGDVNADGYDDLLIGAYGNDGGGDSAGAAYLVLGSASPSDLALSAATAVKLTGEAAADRAGGSVAGAGDVNGDGYYDLLIGAYGNDGGAVGAGAAYLVLGSASPSDLTLSAATAVKLTGEASGNGAGDSVAGPGDFNGDGFDDVLVGAPHYGGSSGPGAAYLVLGSASPADLTLSSTTATKLTGEAAEDHAGERVAGAGDVNGDGYHDLLVGARYNDAGGGDAGAAYLVLGSAKPSALTLSADTAIKYTGERAGDEAAESVAGAGDVNGDGYDDVVVGASKNDSGANNAGAAYLVLSDALSSDNPSFEHRHRLLGNSGNARPAEFRQVGVRVDFSAGALSGGSISARRHVFHPCSTARRLTAPIWTLDSNKVGASASINLRFKYTDAQIAGMNEGSLALWTRPAGEPCSEWSQVSGASVDQDHNTISASVTGLGQYTIGDSAPDPTALRVEPLSVARAGEPTVVVIVTALVVIAAGGITYWLRRRERPAG